MQIYRKDIAALIIIYIVFGLAQASNEFRTLFLSSHGLTATECGRVLAVTSLLTVFTGPIASALADKLRSRRTVYIISTTAWLVFVAVLLLTRHYSIAGFALCAGIMPLINISEPITYNMIEASGVNASILVPKLDFSFIRVALSLGYCLINFAYTPLSKHFGPTAPFICSAVLVVILLVLSGALRKFETEYVTDRKEKKKLELSRLFKNYYLMTFLILAPLLAMGGSTGPYLIYFMDEIGMDSTLVGTASGIRVAGEIILLLSTPFLKKKISLPMLQAVAAAITIIQPVIFLTSRNPVLIMAALAVWGASFGIVLGSRAVFLRALAPEGLDTLTITLYSSTYAVGSVIMSLLGGVIVDKNGIFALYRLSAVLTVLWIALHFASWAFGKYVLKKEPPMPMLHPYRHA